MASGVVGSAQPRLRDVIVYPDPTLRHGHSERVRAIASSLARAAAEPSCASHVCAPHPVDRSATEGSVDPFGLDDAGASSASRLALVLADEDAGATVHLSSVGDAAPHGTLCAAPSQPSLPKVRPRSTECLCHIAKRPKPSAEDSTAVTCSKAPRIPAIEATMARLIAGYPCKRKLEDGGEAGGHRKRSATGTISSPPRPLGALPRVVDTSGRLVSSETRQANESPGSESCMDDDRPEVPAIRLGTDFSGLDAANISLRSLLDTPVCRHGPARPPASSASPGASVAASPAPWPAHGCRFSPQEDEEEPPWVPETMRRSSIGSPNGVQNATCERPRIRGRFSGAQGGPKWCPNGAQRCPIGSQEDDVERPVNAPRYQSGLGTSYAQIVCAESPFSLAGVVDPWADGSAVARLVADAGVAVHRRRDTTLHRFWKRRSRCVLASGRELPLRLPAASQTSTPETLAPVASGALGSVVGPPPPAAPAPALPSAPRAAGLPWARLGGAAVGWRG